MYRLFVCGRIRVWPLRRIGGIQYFCPQPLSMLKSLLLTFSFCWIGFACLCQNPPAPTRSDLEKERETIQREIEDVKRSLDETKKNKKETLGQLALLQRRLRLRESAIRNINAQINYILGDINHSWLEILQLRRELDTLRLQYAESVVYSYENRTNYDFLNFIFSSASFNDAINRIAYLKSYRAYRAEEAGNIQRTQQLLQGKIDGLQVKRQAKDDALQRQNKEMQVLAEEKKEKDGMIYRLQSREKELKKEMSAKQRQDQKLSGAITAAIRRARNDAIREANAKKNAEASAQSNNPAPAAINPPTGSVAVAEPKKPLKDPTIFNSRADLVLSDNFEKNKGRLPWPMDAGNISMHFGIQSYVNGRLRYNNQGITIDADGGTPVKSIFEGEVQSVFNVGDVSAVMLRHGRYFSTYSNLQGVTVTKGQTVKTGELLGRVADIGQLEFVLSDEKFNKFDPEKWLRK